eukprot:TRINITY_DN39880_c0_g1_i1.p1 TRINITY_DN39880_c0_g1~~TRINITY_DN39880_c0_g1_i1.p1  ORF type:complete len:439 (-),score=84.63 TRINITY_DN39880_c0_g1_i1:23-1339(-)
MASFMQTCIRGGLMPRFAKENVSCPDGFGFCPSRCDFTSYLKEPSSTLIHKLSIYRSLPHRSRRIQAHSQLPKGNISVTSIRKDSNGQSGGQKKILACLYKAGKYADNPKFLGCMENALGLKEWLEKKGHTFVVTDDKEGPDCAFERELVDAHIVITTPFHPAYMTKERIQKAKKLELILTAGIGSDHIDLNEAAEKNLTVAEVTGSNSVSVAEDEAMRILILVRNFLPGWQQIRDGRWNVAEVAVHSHDLEAKTVGTVGAGRIGISLLERLKPFNIKMLYYARHKNDEADALGAKWESDMGEFLKKCDVVSLNVPLSDKTKGMFDKEMIAKMKPGAYLVNNARGALVDVQAVVDACNSGHLGGYGGDVWYPQPPPSDHPWRSMPHNAMTPHISGTTLDAQARYAEGTKENLEAFLSGKNMPEDNIIVKAGEFAHAYK